MKPYSFLKHFLVLSFVGLFCSANAQWTIGAFAGRNTTDHTALYDSKIESRIKVGIQTEYRIGKHVSLCHNLAYTQKSMQFTSIENKVVNNKPESIYHFDGYKWDYLDNSAQVKLRLWQRKFIPYIVAGVNYGKKIGGIKETPEAIYYENETYYTQPASNGSVFKNDDIAGLFGIGFEAHIKKLGYLFFEGRQQNSGADINKDENVNFKVNDWSLTGGFAFNLGGK
jgi:hypothetical protein